MKNRETMQKAVIGLVGTLLTVCGTLFGALLSAGVTIYTVERDRQRVEVPANTGDESLTVDTRQIQLDVSAIETLDSEAYDVERGLGFAIAPPQTGWQETERITYFDLFLEEGALSPLILFSSSVGTDWNDQPVHRIRYEDPVTVQYLEESLENGVPVDLDLLRELTGGESLEHYSAIIILAPTKEQSHGYTLQDIALAWGGMHQGGVNQVVANRDSDTILMQTTWRLENVEIDGRVTDLPIERWALFAEGPDRYYIVEVNYVPSAAQPLSVWEDLQRTIDSFRVIQ